MVLLSDQITALKRQLERISLALNLAEKEKKAQASKIQDLGKRLNIALAQRVNELEKYRSEFFGRLKEALGDNPYVRIVGDRFVFQAELLFASGSAQLGEEGKQHLTKLATTLAGLARQIPADINWILRIDGHTDRVPIHTQAFPSNWSLSTARAVSVVNFLAKQGIPENRMAATGFSKFHPLDPADTTDAYRKNRRIEIKLTAR
jgi:chemotaxis protein MotB